MFTMTRLRYRISVFRCISIENVILFRNLAQLPNDIFLSYVLGKTIRDMHYRPFSVVFRVIAYYATTTCRRTHPHHTHTHTDLPHNTHTHPLKSRTTHTDRQLTHKSLSKF